MPTPEQVAEYQRMKSSGEVDALPPEKSQFLKNTYEPLIGGQTTETTKSGLSGLTKEVTTQYPWAPLGMTATVPVEGIRKTIGEHPLLNMISSLVGVDSSGGYEPVKPTVTHTIEGPLTFRKELVNEADKVINMMGRGTMIPLASQMLGGPDIYNALNELTGQTKSEMDASPGAQKFFGELPGNILGGEVVGAIAAPIAGAVSATKVAAPIIESVAKALPTVTKAAKAVFPGISKEVGAGLSEYGQRKVLMASETISDFVNANGGKITDAVAQKALDQGFPLKSGTAKELESSMLADAATQDAGQRGIVRMQAMTPDELDGYFAEKFNFIPSKGKAADAVMISDQELQQKVGEKLNQQSGYGPMDMTKAEYISPENMGGAPTKDKIGSLNINQIPTDREDLRGFIQQMVEPNQELMAKVTPNKGLTFDEAADLGNSLGMNLTKAQTNQLSAMWNPEEKAAIQKLMQEKVYPDLIALRSKINMSDPKHVELWMEELGKTFQLQSNLTGVTSEYGRGLAYAKQVSPTQKLREKVAKIFRGGFDSTDPALKARIAKYSQTLDLNSPESMGNFIQSLGKSQWKRLADANFEMWVNGVLSNPVTHGKNILGNIFTTVTAPIEKAATGAWDAAITKGGNILGKDWTRDRFVSEATATYRGQLHGVQEGAREFLNSMAGQESKISGVGKFGTGETYRIPSIPGKIGKAIRVPGEALRAEDDMFKTILYRGELEGQAVRQAKKEGLTGVEYEARVQALKNDPIQAMKDYATELTKGKDQKVIDRAVNKAAAIGKQMEDASFKAAQVGTFTNELGTIGKSISYVVKEVPGLRYVQPFMKTSANILKYGAKRTPLGLVQLGKEGLTKGEVADILGQVTVGTGAMGGGTLGVKAYLGGRKNRPASEADAKSLAAWTLTSGGFAKIYADGGMTGAAPTNPEVSKGWYASGKIPYAIKIGDRWVSYKDLGPAGITLGMMADVLDGWGTLEQEGASASLGILAMNMAKTYANQSYATGLSDLANAYADPNRYAFKFFSRLAQGEVPFSGSLKFLGNLTDQTLRKPENITQSVMSVIPGLREKVPPVYTVWGDEVKFQYGALGAMSPLRMSQASNDKATQEVDRLQIQPGSINRTLADKVSYNSPAFYLAQQIRGQVAKQKIDRIVQQGYYIRGDDVTKAEKLQDAFTEASAKTRDMLKITYKLPLAKIYIEEFEHAKAQGNEALLQRAKIKMKNLVERQVRGIMPKTKESFEVQPMQSEIVQ